MLVGSVLMTLVLAGDHGRESGVVVGELSVVVCSRQSYFAKGKPLPSRVMATTSSDAAPFLKGM
jgi:hypothetical protein